MKIGMLSLNGPLAPFYDLGVDLLVQVRNRAWRYPGAPQGLGDIFNPANRNARQIHLNQGLFDTAFPALIALDNGCLESLATQLRHPQLHFARLGVKGPLIAACPCILAAFIALVAAGSAQTVSFCIEHRIESFLDSSANHLSQMIPNTAFIYPNDVVHHSVVPIFCHPRISLHAS